MNFEPCPFCGGTDIYSQEICEMGFHATGCMCCGAEVTGGTKEESDANWNRRVLQNPLTLEEALKSNEVVFIEMKAGKNRPYKIFPAMFSQDVTAFHDMVAIYTIGSDSPKFVQIDGCGKYWRPWLRRPTVVECSAVEWKL